MVVDVDRPPLEDGIDELVERKVGPSPGTVDREEAEHGRGKVPEMGIGMRHALVGLLRGSVDRELGVGLLGLAKGHVFIGPVDRRGRGHQEMPDLQPAGGLHHVEGADDVAVEIGARVFEGIAHAGLGCEMDDDVRLELFGDGPEQGLILEKALRRREPLVLKEHLVAALLQGDVVIIRHPVVAMNAQALCKQEPCEMEADEAGGAGDEDAHQTCSIMENGLAPSMAGSAPGGKTVGDADRR